MTKARKTGRERRTNKEKEETTGTSTKEKCRKTAAGLLDFSEAGALPK
jgi:hypothetical protein